MPRSTETLSRQWALLRWLPRAPRHVDTPTLYERITTEGYQTTPRTIERDLEALSTIFPIRCNDASKPFTWSWSADAEAFDLPVMDVHTALTFRLAGEYMRLLVPTATHQYLQPHLKRAAIVLGELPQAGLAAWPEKLRVIPQGLPLLPPVVDQQVLEAVHRGVLDEKRLLISYTRRGESQPKEMPVNPLGLVVRARIVYLVCTAWSYEKVIYLPLHRMHKAAVVDEPRTVPPGFDLDAFVASGAFGFLFAEQPVQLEALVDENLAEIISETPISADQRLEKQADGRWKLIATVPYNQQLRGWVLSYGDLIEVLAPQQLRADVPQVLQRAISRYA